MHVESYVPETPESSILDIGCNVGVWLLRCRDIRPRAMLAGVEINGHALKQINQLTPNILLPRGFRALA